MCQNLNLPPPLCYTGPRIGQDVTGIERGCTAHGTEHDPKADPDPIAPDDAVYGDSPDGLPGAAGIHRGGGPGKSRLGAGGALRPERRVHRPAPETGVAGIHRPPEPLLPPAGFRGRKRPPAQFRLGGGPGGKPLLLCTLPGAGPGPAPGDGGLRRISGGEPQPKRLAGRAPVRPGGGPGPAPGAAGKRPWRWSRPWSPPVWGPGTCRSACASSSSAGRR